jgi:hypothetical protein
MPVKDRHFEHAVMTTIVTPLPLRLDLRFC